MAASQADQLVFNATSVGPIAKNNDSANRKLPRYHKNVALRRKTEPVGDDETDVHAFSPHEKKLQDAGLYGDREKCRTLLQNIAEGVQHLHENKIFGVSLTEQNIYVTDDKSRNAVITEWEEGRDVNEDIKELYQIFEKVRKKCKDFSVGDLQEFEHLIAKLKKGEAGLSYVLGHPFFWSAQEKINFICDKFDACKKKEKKGKKRRETEKSGVEKKLEEAWRPDGQNEWKTKLKLGDTEVTDIRRKYGGDVDREYFYKGAKKGGYKDGLLELMRYFRNLRAHYYERDDRFKSYLQGFPVGFWNFFSRRYPSLLCFVYDNEDSFQQFVYVYN